LLNIPKSIPKNICLILDQVGFNAIAGSLQYTERSRLVAVDWDQSTTPCRFQPADTPPYPHPRKSTASLCRPMHCILLKRTVRASPLGVKFGRKQLSRDWRNTPLCFLCKKVGGIYILFCSSSLLGHVMRGLKSHPKVASTQVGLPVSNGHHPQF
jgi:hypothetical protein